MLRSVVRWIFLLGPCRLYMAGERSGGRVPSVCLPAMFGAAAVGAGLGASAAAVAGSDAGDGASVGIWAGLLVVGLWAVYALVVIMVLWLIGRAPDEVLAAGPDGRERREPLGRDERPEERLPWRQPGDRLIPARLLAFLAFVTLASLVAAAWKLGTEDSGFWLGMSGVTGVLLVLSIAGFVVEERRRR